MTNKNEKTFFIVRWWNLFTTWVCNLFKILNGESISQDQPPSVRNVAGTLVYSYKGYDYIKGIEWASEWVSVQSGVTVKNFDLLRILDLAERDHRAFIKTAKIRAKILEEEE